jgi:hypothetical protein
VETPCSSKFSDSLRPVGHAAKRYLHFERNASFVILLPHVPLVLVMMLFRGAASLVSNPTRLVYLTLLEGLLAESGYCGVARMVGESLSSRKHVTMKLLNESIPENVSKAVAATATYSQRPLGADLFSP